MPTPNRFCTPRSLLPNVIGWRLASDPLRWFAVVIVVVMNHYAGGLVPALQIWAVMELLAILGVHSWTMLNRWGCLRMVCFGVLGYRGSFWCSVGCADGTRKQGSNTWSLLLEVHVFSRKPQQPLDAFAKTHDTAVLGAVFSLYWYLNTVQGLF